MGIKDSCEEEGMRKERVERNRYLRLDRVGLTVITISGLIFTKPFVY
jgi:hypothetical protein